MDMTLLETIGYYLSLACLGIIAWGCISTALDHRAGRTPRQVEERERQARLAALSGRVTANDP